MPSSRHYIILLQTASIMLKGYPEKETNNLYLLKMKLTKPISDDQNTRGRKLNDPEETSRSFGLLTSVVIPQVSRFQQHPVTRIRIKARDLNTNHI